MYPLTWIEIRFSIGFYGSNSSWEVLAEAQHSVPYPDTTPLSEFFTAIAMALLEVVSRPDADDRQLRMAGYNALSVAERSQPPGRLFWCFFWLALLLETYCFGSSSAHPSPQTKDRDFPWHNGEVLVSKAGNDCLGHMQALTQEMLKHLQESYKSMDRVSWKKMLARY